MRTWFNNLFIGRQGMDELSKAMFWWGLASLLLSAPIATLLNGVPASILSWLGLLLVVFCFIRAFWACTCDFFKKFRGQRHKNEEDPEEL